MHYILSTAVAIVVPGCVTVSPAASAPAPAVSAPAPAASTSAPALVYSATRRGTQGCAPESAKAAAGRSSLPAAQTDSLIETQHLQAVTVTASTRARRTAGAENTLRLGQQELFRAACCNLGESFVTNPSVDVSYDDAATGAAQIKLLGLSGRYVQMLTETMPAFRGAAQSFALGYVPGTWMKAINVSKGASSVKNGYESITGQIDIDYLKPDDERAVGIDIFCDDGLAFQAEGTANLPINDRLSTGLLLHYQNEWTCADDNGDGFQDMPRVVQYNLSNRWKYRSPRYIMHAGIHVINEERTSRTMDGVGLFPAADGTATPHYRIGIDTRRYEGYMKHAFVLDPDHGGNIALMANASWHDLAADYGSSRSVPLNKHYDVKQLSINAQLMYETQLTDRHALSTGLSLVRHEYDQHLGFSGFSGVPGVPGGSGFSGMSGVSSFSGFSGGAAIPFEAETVPGVYGQYTYTLDRAFTLMAGLRYDHSSFYGSFVTPRLHLKWSPREWVTLRASSGLGYRSPHAFAENHNLLASGRTFVVRPDAGSERLDLEKAWNSGASVAFTIPAGERVVKLNAEYYYTHFLQQTVIDYEHTPGAIVVHNLRDADARYGASGMTLPKSFSHVVQVDAQYEFFPGFDVTAAYRHNVVRCTYGNVSADAVGSSVASYALRDQILTPRFKALLSLCYQTPLKLWQFDATLAVNGPGRLPDASFAAAAPGAAAKVGSTTFGAMESLSAQVTRCFRHCDIYVGGENLTNRMQRDAVVGAANPWSTDFEPTLVYGSPAGYMVYAGLRLKL